MLGRVGLIPAVIVVVFTVYSLQSLQSYSYTPQAGCALVARLLAAARVFEIAVKAGYVSC
jgi:hypothetical protein